MRSRLVLVALPVLPLAWTPLAGQGGALPLDSATLAALAPLRARIDSAPVLRLSTLWGRSILVRPRLEPVGIGYRERRGAEPRIDGRAFRLQTRSRATGAGAVAGAILGGLAGAAYGRVAAGIACVDAEGPCSTSDVRPIIAGTVLGIGFGAMSGAVIGTLVPSWHTIYRHPDP